MALIIVMTTFGLSACDGNNPQEGTGGARQVQVIINIPLNSEGHTVEQQNIIDRIRVTTDPTKVLWIHLIALDGKIIKRMPIKNKVTSSGKRLEPTQATDGQGNAPNFKGWETSEFIQADGTFGESDPYIYWFDPMGRYHQWGTAGGLGYPLTDYPIDLENPIDSITGLYNVHKAAFDWQQQQEALLKEKEGK